MTTIISLIVGWIVGIGTAIVAFMIIDERMDEKK